MLKITSFDQIVGNEDTKLLLNEAITTAKNNNTALDHIILYGASGCGKSMFAEVIAKTMGVEFQEVNCALINTNPQIFNQMIMKMQDRGILFLDEIHSLKDVYYESMFKYIDEGIIFIKYPDKLVPVPISKKITLICATSEIQQVPIPFYNRMNITIKVQPYNHDTINIIAKLNLDDESIDASEDAVSILCNASRGIPRNLHQFIRVIKNYKCANNITFITSDHIKMALSRMGIDEYGLDEVDRTYIRYLHYIFNNMPTGIAYLASVMDENEQIIVTKHEPFLLKSGYITRTSKGRMLQPKGILHAIEIGPGEL